MSDAPPRLGGMALANGLLVHGPTHWATAVRTADGSVTIASGRKPQLARGPLASVPLVRGVLRMAEALAVVPTARLRTPGARLAMENVTVVGVMAGAMLTAAIARRRLRSVPGQEAVGALAGLAPALVALRASDAAMWHAVEHKCIAAYEEGGSAEVAHAADHAKEHPRCGSNVVVPLMTTTVMFNTVLRRVVRRPSMSARLTATAASVGAALEVFAFAVRNPTHPAARVVQGIGHTLQARLATVEPSRDDLDVGRAAMYELIRLETSGADTE